MNSCKLSERFVKKDIQSDVIEQNVAQVQDIVPEQDMAVGQEAEIFESDDMLSKLVSKVNSVPVWHDYSLEEQETLASIFIKKNFDNFDRSLLANVIGLGIIQPLVENQNVSQILIDVESSVKIVIGDNIYDTEIYLSDLQRTYLENCVSNFKNEIYHDSKFSVKFFVSDDNRIVIKKV